ncbi:MAG: hypothetical protein AAGA81_01665 [Acidobacteriota bacterium]
MNSARFAALVRAAVPMVGLALFALPASAQQACNASNLTGMWKLVSEEPVVDPPTKASADYLEIRSGLLFWVVQPTDGPRTRSRHRPFFAGSKVDVQPALDRAPEIIRCTRSGRALTLITSSTDGQRRGRLEFRRTGS